MGVVRWVAGLSAAVVMAGLASTGAQAMDEAAMRARVAETLKAHVAALEADPTVIAALKDANVAHAGYSDADIDAMDKAWREQTKTGRGPLIDPILANAASKVLRDHQAKSLGMMAEIFVFDAKGLNVAQTNITSDYLQADEPKYQETFPKGPGAVHVEAPKFDESANTYVMTGSGTISDPATGQPVGAVTVNVDLAKL